MLKLIAFGICLLFVAIDGQVRILSFLSVTVRLFIESKKFSTDLISFASDLKDATVMDFKFYI